MAASKLENVWRIMRNNSYEIVTDIDNDLLCLLCKRLLNNARCAPCGCRFCFTCISGLLNGENNICPGNTEECKLEMLNLNENIFVDHSINVRISRIKVKCSEMSCEFVDEIRKIEDHSRMCKYRSVACPYLNIGCDTCNISQDKIVYHLKSEILTHTELLMDFIGNFSNEMDIMKANNQLLQTEINELKLDGERKRQEIVDLQGRLDECNIKCINANQLRENKEKEIIRRIDQNEKKQRSELAKISNEIYKTVQNVDGKLLEMTSNQNKLINSEFVWKLDKFSDKMNDAKNGIKKYIYSEPFLTHRNGYKMCLLVFPNGDGGGQGTHLSVFYCLMKGEHDGILKWPFTHPVTFVLINQRTRLVHASYTEEYEANSNSFDQPTDINIGRGSELLPLSELSTNSDLMLNNQIFIKCSVNIQL